MSLIALINSYGRRNPKTFLTLGLHLTKKKKTKPKPWCVVPSFHSFITLALVSLLDEDQFSSIKSNIENN